MSSKNQHVVQSKLPPMLPPKSHTSTTSPTSLQSPSPYHTDSATSAGDVGSSDSDSYEDVMSGDDDDEEEVVKTPWTMKKKTPPETSPSSPPLAEVDLW